MPLEIIHGDITKVKCDAMVNAANSKLRGGGGIDRAIHSAAGPKLHEECKTIGGCKPGHSVITKGYDLPCKYVIHTVGPHWFNGKYGEHDTLVSCYRESLKLAKEYDCKTIAFPLIATGAYGYPKEQALETAINEITAFLQDNPDFIVYLVLYER